MLNVIGFQFLQWQTDVYYILKHLVKSVLQKPFYLLLINTKIINQYHITYTLYSGLNYVSYLNIIKRDHVSATVRTRLHLASGWSLDHSGAQYSYVGVRTRVGCRHMISFYNIPPIISVFKLQITICNKFRKMLRLIKKHTQGEMQKWKKDGTFTIRINN